MKNLFSFLLAAFLCQVSMAQSPRNVVLEYYTGTWTGWAPDAQVKLLDIWNTYPDLLNINYHISDNLTNSEGEDIQDFFNVGGYPTGSVDRKIFGSSSSVPHSRENWATNVATQYNTSSPCVIEIELSYDDQTRDMQVNAEVEFTNNVNGNMRLHVLVMEDSVTGYPQQNYYSSQSSGAGGSSHPFYNQPNPVSNFVHLNVFREALSSQYGDAGVIPSSVSNGDVYSEDYSYTIPNNFDEDRISVLAFVSYYASGGASGNDILNAQQIHLAGAASPCAADFSHSVNGSTANFTNNSTGALSYEWDFGDGNVSTSTSPSHNYASGGTYTVTLRGLDLNDNVCDSMQQEVTIESSAQCEASFNASINGFLVTFNNTSTGAASTHEWSFGDGTQTTQASPLHVYNSAGTYTVILEAYDSAGVLCDVDSQNIFISGTLSCTPNFTWSGQGTTVSFQNTSTGNYISQEWHFGDGAFSIASNPTYVYAQDGTYTVCLTLYGDSGVQCGVICKSVEVYPVGISETSESGNEVRISPNPANDLAMMTFKIEKASQVRIALFDNLGREVRVVRDEYLLPGEHNGAIVTSDLPNGLYLVHIQQQGSVVAKRLVIEH